MDFEELWHKTNGEVRALLYCTLRDWAEVDDLTQECYCRAFRNWDQYSGQGSRRSWLFSIVRNASVDWIRKRVRAADKAPKQFSRRDENDPAVEIEIVEQMERLWEEVGDLEDRYNQVIYLRFAGGLSYAEISESLNIPTGTVRSRIHRGLKQLKAKLE